MNSIKNTKSVFLLLFGGKQQVRCFLKRHRIENDDAHIKTIQFSPQYVLN